MISWPELATPVTGAPIPQTWGQAVNDTLAALKSLMPIATGILTSTGRGQWQNVAIPHQVNADSYRVMTSWQEDPGLEQGEIIVSKEQDFFLICNTGNGTGVKFAYEVKPT